MEWFFKIRRIEDGLSRRFGKQSFISDSDGIAYSFVTMETLAIHRITDRNAQINVVVDAGFVFTGIVAMQSSGVLCNKSFPRHREGEHQSVKPRKVKSFSYVFAGGDNN